MAAKEEIKAVYNPLSCTCTVCCKVLKNPKYLPCYHYCCKECLYKRIQGQYVEQFMITCPVCEQEAILSAKQIEELPDNILISHLANKEALRSQINGKEEALNCDNCIKDDPVSHFCLDCTLFLCKFCHDYHKRDKILHDHNIVTLNELRSTKHSIEPQIVIPLCKKHKTELLYYCETCKELVCVYCCKEDTHAAHAHKTAKIAAVQHRDKLKKRVTDSLEDINKGLCTMHDDINNKLQKIKEQSDEVDREIDQIYDNIIQVVMEQKAEVKQQAQNIVSQKEETAAVQLEEVEDVQAQVSKIMEFGNVVEASSDQEILTAEKQVENHIQVLTEKYEDLTAQSTRSTMIGILEFVPTEDYTVLNLPQFGQLFTCIDPIASTVTNLPSYAPIFTTVEFSIISKYHTGHHCHIGGSKVSVVLKLYNTQIELKADITIRDRKDGSYLVSFAAKEVGKIKIFMSVNEQEIRESPRTILIHKSYSAINLPSNIINGGESAPWGIAFSTIGIWAFADWSNNRVCICNEQNQLIKAFGSRGSREGEMYRPEGLAFDSTNNLYVVDHNNHRVQKFDIHGNYLLQFGEWGCDEGKLRYPRGITTHEYKVYVVDRENHRISVFQNDGQFDHTIGESQLSDPHDVAINPQFNRLYVADYVDHCIHIITLDGNYIKKVTNKGTFGGQLYQPYSLACDMNGYVLVGEAGNHCVTIYDKDGIFKHCFGSSGFDIGQFGCPRGIALNANGTIFVCDSGGIQNNRIQIFSLL